MKKLFILTGKAAYWVTWPGIFICLLFTRRTRVAVVVDDEIIMTKGWLGNGRWLLPGGGLRAHENPEDGAVRELREETGLKIDSGQLQHKFTGWNDFENGFQYKYHAFLVELPTKQQLKTPSGELIACEWLPVEKFKSSKTLNRIIGAGTD